MKNLKNVSYACCSITSRAGTSSPRVSRSRECPSIFSDSFSWYSPGHCRYNPVLGEFFRCRYDYPNGTQGFYIAEQGAYGPSAPCASVLHVRISLFFYLSHSSLAPSTYIRLLLRFTSEQGRCRRRASAKVQVPRQLCLDGDGGREPHHAHGPPRGLW